LERLERVRPGLLRPDLEFEPVYDIVNLAECLFAGVGIRPQPGDRAGITRERMDPEVPGGARPNGRA
jgi:hypothetical protein